MEVDAWHPQISSQCLISEYVSSGCCNKLSQSGWLKTTHIYSVKSGGQKSKISFMWLKSRCKVKGVAPSRGSERRIHFFAFGQLQVTACSPWLVASSSVSKEYDSLSSDSPCVPLKRNTVVTQAHFDKTGYIFPSQDPSFNHTCSLFCHEKGTYS